MHIAIHAVGIKHSGGATVLQDFLLAAIADDRISRITVFCSPRAVRNFELPASEKLAECVRGAAERSRLYRAIWSEFSLPRECKRMGVDVLVCMTGIGKAQPPIPHITFIQQSLPFYAEREDSLQAKASFRLRAMIRLRGMKSFMARSCRSAQRVIVQTPTMRRWVSEAFRISPSMIDVIAPSIQVPQPSHAWEQASEMLSVPEGSRLLYVGSDAPHKNVERIIVGIGELRKAIPLATLFLTWPRDHPAGKTPGIVCLGHLPRTALFSAYQCATMLVMPSLVETVGLPMLEAMAIGTPVLTADRPYAHDVCEHCAEFFDPLSVESFVSVAGRALRDPETLLDLSRKGKLLIERRNETRPYTKMISSILEVPTETR